MERHVENTGIRVRKQALIGYMLQLTLLVVGFGGEPEALAGTSRQGSPVLAGRGVGGPPRVPAYFYYSSDSLANPNDKIRSSISFSSGTRATTSPDFLVLETSPRDATLSPFVPQEIFANYNICQGREEIKVKLRRVDRIAKLHLDCDIGYKNRKHQVRNQK